MRVCGSALLLLVCGAVLGGAHLARGEEAGVGERVGAGAEVTAVAGAGNAGGGEGGSDWGGRPPRALVRSSGPRLGPSLPLRTGPAKCMLSDPNQPTPGDLKVTHALQHPPDCAKVRGPGQACGDGACILAADGQQSHTTTRAQCAELLAIAPSGNLRCVDPFRLFLRQALRADAARPERGGLRGAYSLGFGRV